MDLNAAAIKVKESALLWVYVIEWFTVSASAMIAGSFLYIVMVKEETVQGDWNNQKNRVR